MNTPKIELCKELYKLSGWESDIVFCQSGSYREKYGEKSEKGWFIYSQGDAILHHKYKYPYFFAYDKALTVEDAAIRLAIKLFKKGILTKESEDA